MLNVHQTKYSDTIFLALTGQFDHHSIAGLEIFILGAPELECKHVILEFAGVTSIDSISLDHLFMWYQKMQPHGVSLRIVNPHPRIQAVLGKSRISDVIPINFLDLEAILQKPHSPKKVGSGAASVNPAGECSEDLHSGDYSRRN